MTRTTYLAGLADDVLLPVPASMFRAALEIARRESALIREATSDPADMPDGRYWLTVDGKSGFGIVAGELIGVHSLIRGRGDAMVSLAVRRGAVRLDCFDGYLPALYARHGFVETSRVPNWTPGGPDVVYMAHPGA